MSHLAPSTLILTALFLAVCVPVFFGKLRVAPQWLSLQALALGWLVLAAGGALHALATGLEILALRGMLVPWMLRAHLKRHERVAHVDLMPSNLFAWGIAIALIVVAFRFGDGAGSDARALTLGVVACVLTIAYLILATNQEPFAQLVAVLYMENAVLLFETLLPHPWPLPIHLLLAVVYVGTAALGLWLQQEPLITAAQEDTP